MKILKAIFGGIAKVIGYLMVTLGLWLPALFTVTFFITCAATHTALTKSVMAVFYCGLGVAAVAGLALAMHLRTRRKQKDATAVAAPAKPPREKKRKHGKTEAQPENMQPPYGYASMPPYGAGTYPPPYPPSYGYPQSGGGYASNGYMQSGGYGQSAPYAGVREDKSRTASKGNVRDLERKYFPDGVPTAAESYGRTASFDDDSKPNAYSAEYALSSEELWRRLSGADVPDEQPLVFRTRKDSNVYVYEYSDRYQYWRRTKSGMVLERTEFKEAERSVKSR